MKEFEEKIDKIRAYYKQQKAENYPIKDHPILYSGDEVQKLYMEMLAAILEYSENPGEAQFMFLQRILSGIGKNERVDDVMARALNIDFNHFEHFVMVLKNGTLKYNFCVDAMILVGVSVPCEQKELEFLAEIFELLNVREEELVYLCGVANSILEQSSERFIALRSLRPETIENALFKCYLDDFFVGLLVDTPEEKHYYACRLSEISLDMGTKTNTEKNYTFENLSIRLESDWEFEGNESVVFKDCVIMGGEYKFCFSGVGRVEFFNCTVKAFSCRVAKLEKVKKLILNHSRFHNCGCKMDRERGTVSGGLFTLSEGDMELIRIADSQFLSCYVEQNNNTFGPYGVVLNGNGRRAEEIRVLRNRFVNCTSRNGKETDEDRGLIYNLKRGNETVEDNKYLGPVKTMFMGCR